MELNGEARIKEPKYSGAAMNGGSHLSDTEGTGPAGEGWPAEGRQNGELCGHESQGKDCNMAALGIDRLNHIIWSTKAQTSHLWITDLG